jgi:hypothetical protein
VPNQFMKKPFFIWTIIAATAIVTPTYRKKLYATIKGTPKRPR